MRPRNHIRFVRELLRVVVIERGKTAKPLLALIIFLGCMGLAHGAEPLAVGAKVPEVRAVNQDGMPLDLANVARKGFVLVYFYPKADTPGCTAEACSLRDAFTQLTEKGVKVIGVSADTIEAQEKFIQKYNLPFTLIADADHRVIDVFGVSVIPGMNVASRQSFLFRDGVVVWRDLKASTDRQAADVLKVLENLK